MEDSFLSQFKTLHDRAKKGQLELEERRMYERRRDDLARALGASQRSSPAVGETWLSILRVERALRVELALPTGRVRTVTTEIMLGSLSAVSENLVAPGTPLGITLYISQEPPLVFTGRVVASSLRPPRIAIRFDPLPSQSRERLLAMIFDAILASA